MDQATPSNVTNNTNVDATANTGKDASATTATETPTTPVNTTQSAAGDQSTETPAPNQSDDKPQSLLSEKTSEDKTTTDTQENAKQEDYTINPPDGYQINDSTLSALKTAAKAAGIEGKAMQEVVNAVLPAMAKAQLENIKTEQNRWISETKNDETIGRGNLKETTILANKALDSFDQGGEIRKLLEDSGLVNHKSVLRFLRNIGKATSEDLAVTGAAGDSSDASLVKKYPYFKNIVEGKV